MKKYTFFLGLKDKNSKLQIRPDSEYMLECQTLTANLLGGWTLSKWVWVFRHDDGTLVYENCIIIQTLCFDAHEDMFTSFATTLKNKYNQESVLMEVSEVTAEFI